MRFRCLVIISRRTLAVLRPAVLLYSKPEHGYRAQNCTRWWWQYDVVSYYSQVTSIIRMCTCVDCFFLFPGYRSRVRLHSSIRRRWYRMSAVLYNGGVTCMARVAWKEIERETGNDQGRRKKDNRKASKREREKEKERERQEEGCELRVKKETT